MNPLLILVVSVALIFVLIIRLRINAFIALLAAATCVGLLGALPVGGRPAVELSRIMPELTGVFGSLCGSIGVVIAMAALIGHCLMESGAADKITRRFVGLLGEKNASASMLLSGYILAIPVFFDTVFYLLIPLARALRLRTGKNYLLFTLAICAGGGVTHCLVPPTPGPLAIAATLGIDLGTMILTGMAVGIPMSLAGWAFAKFMDARMPLELREAPGMSLDALRALADRDEKELPPFWLSILPVALPVLLIASDTIARAVDPKSPLIQATGFLGNANFALMLSAAIAMGTLAVRKKLSLAALGASLEPALAGAGLIILITAAGGAYGGMLKLIGVGTLIAGHAAAWGIPLLTMGFLLSAILKISQGSSTVAMITVSSIVAPLILKAPLDYHPVYIGTAIASGSLVGSWMNDSGFWVYKQMSGFTEAEALKTWTPLLVVLGVVGYLGSVAGSLILPMALAAPR